MPQIGTRQRPVDNLIKRVLWWNGSSRRGARSTHPSSRKSGDFRETPVVAPGVTRCFRTVLLNSGLDRQMEHEKHKHFSPEFRAAAVARVAEGDKSIVKVAAALGINHRTLWTWVNAARLKTIDPAGELTPQARKRIRDLEKENALLRRDLDFEKKAKAFFLEL
ncbi:hypothetical protein E3T40_10420, partial [Cryobacterium sp. TMT1-19]|uniref:transposase n=1 Tax=Cryobacterium sp. TMT1-19 TaxID=1259231 RepID=UPI0011010D19